MFSIQRRISRRGVRQILLLTFVSVILLTVALNAGSTTSAWADTAPVQNNPVAQLNAPGVGTKIYLPLTVRGSGVFAPAPTAVPTVVRTSTPVPLPTSVPVGGNCETRAAWLNPNALLRGDALITDLLNARLNTIFVLAPPVGNNNGWSDPATFAAFTQRAKQYGFSVHGWVANAYRNGVSWADYTSATEQTAQANWALTLLNTYPYLDGVHLDYIRYEDFALIDGRMNAVNATVAKIASAVKSKYPNKVITAAVRHDEPTPAYPGSEPIPSWFQSWSAATPANQNWYVGSTTYIPWGMRYQQDPVSWVRAGTLDALVTMQYALDDELWQNQSYSWLSFLTYQINRPTAGIMGLGWYTGTVDTHDPASIVRKIKFGRSIGIRGFSIFELSERTNGVYYNDQPLISALTTPSAANNYQPPFTSSVPSCLPVK